MYREYTLTIRPSRDFLQELLWHGRNIIVLKPEAGDDWYLKGYDEEL